MKVVSVNVGARETVGKTETGIVKRPVEGPVVVNELGIESDVIVHEYHGGVDQAVYVYRQEDYAWWASELGRALEPGLFGENLTLAGIPTPDPIVGSRILLAEVELEVTAPRIPCATLAARMGEDGFVQRFLQAKRPGLYCRVTAVGRVAAGEQFTFESGGGDVTLGDLLDAYAEMPDNDGIRRLLAAPLSKQLRTWLEERLDDTRR